MRDLRKPGPARQDGSVSVLEFITSIKWPVTVLLLAGVVLLALRRSPDTRRSMAAWLNRRNIRLHFAGQEIEATIDQIQGSMDVAAENDSALAASVVRSELQPAEGAAAEPSPAAVEFARRAAIENVLRNAANLGWQWARSGKNQPPLVEVSWNADGQPTLAFRDSGNLGVQNLVTVAALERILQGESDPASVRNWARARTGAHSTSRGQALVRAFLEREAHSRSHNPGDEEDRPSP